MAEGGARFEDTMDALEEQRERIELHFNELLAQIGAYAAEAGENADRVAAEVAARDAARSEAPATTPAGGLDGAADAGFDDPSHWPRGAGPRRWINRLARWLLRDYLQVLDRRRDQSVARVAELLDRCAGLRQALAAERASTQALHEAVHATLAPTQQALHATLAAQREMLTLVNAKDAEVLQRAVAGPLRRMEVVFDEFARRQEALLSQLVGRRRELDELARGRAPAADGEN